MRDLQTVQKLNKAQLDAIRADSGPILVVAGAGTGKTTVIVERIGRLLSRGVSPKRLLALTFTEKAATEMLDRVNLALGAYHTELPILTFNAFGESQLRRYGADIGLGRNFTVMSESARIVFMRQRMDELGLDYYAPLSSPDSLLGDIADYFSRLKQNVVTSSAYADFVKKLPKTAVEDKLELKKHRELAAAYAAYLKLCRAANVVDYDDQIYLLIDMLRQRPNVLRTIQQNYDYVMVDEFQDTNRMQSELVNMIARQPFGETNLFVVGDDDQSIYGWRGATLANILDFKQHYPNTKEVTLVRNYRSTKQILDTAYRLIKHNNPYRLEEQLKINKRLTTSKSGKEPSVVVFESIEEELTWIAKAIKKRLAQGTQPGDIAVMARRNTTVGLISQHLQFAGVDHAVASERYDLYKHPSVRMLLEALRTVVDSSDNTSLYHTLAGPLFSISPAKLSGLSSLARRSHMPLTQVIAQSTDKSLDDAKTALKQISAWRDKLSQMTVGQLAYEMLTVTGYIDFIQGGKEPAADVAASRLGELFKTFKEFEQIAIVPSAVQYIEALPALQAAADESDDNTLDLSGQKVNVLTIHKAKGLEWPIVYIADCTEGSFPLRQQPRGIALPEGLALKTSEADDHIAEERRLMYVAMTRARDELILTHAKAARGGSTRKPSRFLSEAFKTEEFIARKPHGLILPRLLSFQDDELKQKVNVPATMVDGNHVRLTISQAEKYLRCPLDFYYRYVLCVPENPNPSRLYGTLMHNLIEDINRSLLAGRLIGFKQLEKRLTAAWPKVGYLTPKHRDRAYAQAQITLRKLRERLAAENRLPLAVEEPFVFTAKEARLSVSGRFDAVLPLGNRVEIVDYKTAANVDTPQKAKTRAQNSHQLTFYALAWQFMHNEIPALVTLDFIETGQKGSLKKSERGLASALARLQNVADGIRARDFPPGHDHRYCIHYSV